MDGGQINDRKTDRAFPYAPGLGTWAIGGGIGRCNSGVSGQNAQVRTVLLVPCEAFRSCLGSVSDIWLGVRLGSTLVEGLTGWLRRRQDTSPASGVSTSGWESPNLFRYRIKNNPRVFIYVDLGGSDVVKIYEDSAAMLYAPDLEDEELNLL